MTADRDPSGSPVAPVRRTSRGPSARLVMLLVAAAVTAAVVVALVPGSGPLPSPAPSPVAAAVSPSSSAAASSDSASSASPGASPDSSPASSSSVPVPGTLPASVATVVVLRGLVDPAGALGTLTGCPEIRRVAGPSPEIRGPDVDAVATAAGRETGWLFVPPGVQAATKVWLGDDVVELARAAGEHVVGVGEDGAVWLGGAAGATRWRPTVSPAGRTAWVMTADEVVGAGRCGPWSVPGLIAGQRSLTCAGIGLPGCLDLLPVVHLQALDLFAAGADLVVAVPPCVDNPRCFAPPSTFISVPPRWSGARLDLRVASSVPPSRGLAPVSGDQLPDYALDALARPALRLPIARGPRSGDRCPDALVGELQGAPWDPRVAWIGTAAVAWPAGTVGRFLPALEVTGPDLAAPAHPGDRLALAGRWETGGGIFDACTALETAAVPAATTEPAATTLPAATELPAVTPGPLAGRGTGG